MTQEDKQLLLKDLCARLPYGVKAQGIYEEEADYRHPFAHAETMEGGVEGIDHIGFDNGEIYVTIEGMQCELSDVKLYLRPMSSMTKEEQKEFVEFHCVTLCPLIMDSCLTIENEGNMLDWLNAHHFDYRGLIEKGLAIEAPKGMYKKGE